MTRHRNEVYQDKHGTWWARVNGQRKTWNTYRETHRLYQEMLDEAQRAATARGEPPYMQGAEVIVLRGAPGCGKTTWAKNYIAEHPYYVRISRDCLREMFHFGEYTPEREKFIRKMRRRLIRECLEEHGWIIIDDTNLKDRDIRDINSAAHIYSQVIGQEGWLAVPVRIVDIEATAEECIARDAARPHPVGAERIREMHEQHMRILGK